MVRNFIQQLTAILRELSRIPDYEAEANNLYRELRTQRAAPEQIFSREARSDQEQRERRGRRREAIAGIATFI